MLVSNAAYQRRKESLDDLSDEELEHTFDTNIFAYVRLTRAALRHMKPGSAIIATSSETGILGSAKLPDYSATKGAINAFTKTLAQSLVKKGIRVNAVAPGPVWTPLNPSDAGLPPEDVAKFGQQAPIGRPAQPEELAPAYVFLASNADSSYITGTVLQVMGAKRRGVERAGTRLAPSRSVFVRVHPGEFGAQKKDLRRVVDPHQQDDERASRAKSGSDAAAADIQADEELAYREEKRGHCRADPDVVPGDLRARQELIDEGKQSHRDRERRNEVDGLEQQCPPFEPSAPPVPESG